MKQIKIIIEASKDSFGAYAEDDEYPVTGVGDTVQEAKQSALDCIEIQKELGNLPKQNFDVIFKYDTQSILAYYKGVFTNAALQRITGINQQQMSHYATGLKKPRLAQKKKIETSLHKLGSELLAIEL
ncbi:MAG: hypothetical protein LBE82_07220 [Chitinophagaceae bacterium]|jgi:hypothetical protein|nr:hypothetical protein [Chitinophagaceae bacterium]